MKQSSIISFFFACFISSYSVARCVYLTNQDKLHPNSSFSRFLFVNGIKYNDYLWPNSEASDLKKVVSEGLCKEIETKTQMDLIRELQSKMSSLQIDCFVLQGPEVGFVIKPNSSRTEIATSRFALNYLSTVLKRADCQKFQAGSLEALTR